MATDPIDGDQRKGGGGTEPPVKAVDTAVQVLEVLDNQEGATVTAISKQLGMSKSTVHRHLSTLENGRLVVKRDGRYYLGLRFLELGNSALDHHSFHAVAKPLVDELVRETRESCHVAVEEHGRAVYLHYARSETGVKTDAHPGIPLYMHCTATGKALLAHLPDERVSAILDRHGLPAKTDNTITRRDRLFDELAEIRDRGVAFGDEERVDGMRGVAAPITDRDSQDLLGALTIAGPTKRIKGDRFRVDLPELLERTTKIIEVELSYGGNPPSSFRVDDLDEGPL